MVKRTKQPTPKKMTMKKRLALQERLEARAGFEIEGIDKRVKAIEDETIRRLCQHNNIAVTNRFNRIDMATMYGGVCKTCGLEWHVHKQKNNIKISKLQAKIEKILREELV